MMNLIIIRKAITIAITAIIVLYIFMIVHEFGHAITVILLKGKVVKISLNLSNASVSHDGKAGPSWLVSLSGSMGVLIIGTILLPISLRTKKFGIYIGSYMSIAHNLVYWMVYNPTYDSYKFCIRFGVEFSTVFIICMVLFIFYFFLYILLLIRYNDPKVAVQGILPVVGENHNAMKDINEEIKFVEKQSLNHKHWQISSIDIEYVINMNTCSAEVS